MYRILVACLLAAFVLVPVGCQNKGKSGGQAALTTAGRQTMSREDFEKAVKGKTAAEVVKAVGEPDRKMPTGNKEEWRWASLTKNGNATKPDIAAVAYFENGRVARVEFVD